KRPHRARVQPVAGRLVLLQLQPERPPGPQLPGEERSGPERVLLQLQQEWSHFAELPDRGQELLQLWQDWPPESRLHREQGPR
ncbi:hypothetical protein pipiens_020319, partial [Culex pipiens pipiens]